MTVYLYIYIYIPKYVYICACIYSYMFLFQNFIYSHICIYINLFLRRCMCFILLMARILFVSTGSDDQSFAWLHGLQRFCTYGNKSTYEYNYVHVYVCICLNQDSSMRVFFREKQIYMAFSSSAGMVRCIHTYMYKHMRICI